jgi:hypothetical protein
MHRLMECYQIRSFVDVFFVSLFAVKSQSSVNATCCVSIFISTRRQRLAMAKNRTKEAEKKNDVKSMMEESSQESIDIDKSHHRIFPILNWEKKNIKERRLSTIYALLLR